MKSFPSTAEFVRLSLCLAFLGAGCGSKDPGDGDYSKVSKGERLEVRDVPTDLIEAAKKKLPNVEFTEAWKNLDKDKKLHSYEIRGKDPKTGKTREVRVALDGSILESE